VIRAALSAGLHVCCYGRVEKIHFDGAQICRDIAAKAVS